MRTLTNNELIQLAGGFKKNEENDIAKNITLGLSLGVFIGLYVQGKGLARSSAAVAITMGCCFLVNKTVRYCASFLPSSST